jgi:UDPglucose--hexose-1-phosphate uridylyltransferase
MNTLAPPLPALDAPIRVTATQLADGRDLFYFDDSPDYTSGRFTRRLDDPRPMLPAKPANAIGPEMRLDVLTGEWIPMAAHRMNRTFLPPSDACPLCPARPSSTYCDGEIPATSYDVVVFENRFPSFLRLPGQNIAAQWTGDGEPMWPRRHAAGRCEVVVFSQDHTGSVSQMSRTRVRTIIEAWAERTAALEAMDGIVQVYPFENRGREIGVTLPHPHGQIYAYPVLPPRGQDLMREALAWRERTGRSLLRDVLDAELRAGIRVVFETEHWVAYVPQAARWPVEAHLAPRRDVASLPDLTEAERDDLAGAYLRLLQIGDCFFAEEDGTPIALPYIAGWHQAPVPGQWRDLGRLHLQFFSFLRSPGKLKYLAGSESGMGAWISDTTPELIAARMKEAAHELDQL